MATKELTCCNRVKNQAHTITVSVGSYFWSFCSFECLEVWTQKHARFSIEAVNQMIDKGIEQVLREVEEHRFGTEDQDPTV
jgi:hypothetical protein